MTQAFFRRICSLAILLLFAVLLVLSLHPAQARLVDATPQAPAAAQADDAQQARTPPPSDPKYTRFEHIAVEDGLSHATVLSIIQDQDGLMWFGSQDGLNRYDGYTITVFRHDKDDPNSLSHNNVFPVYETRDGMIWIGTDPGGLNRYDKHTGTFTVYRHDPNNPDSISDDSVWAIYEDSKGTLWLGTRGGLNRLDRATGKFKAYHHVEGNSRSLGNDLIYRIYEDRQGTLWVGTRAGLNRYDTATDDFTLYQNDPANPDSLRSNRVWAIYEDHLGTLWVGTRGGGLNILDRQTGKFSAYRHDPNDPNSIGDDNIWSLLEDRSGGLWITTERAGLNRFDRVTGRFVRYEHNPNDPHSISHNDVFWLCEDNSGVLWISSRRNGVNKLYPALQRFTHYHHIPEDPNSLNTNNVIAIAAEPVAPPSTEPGGLWIGTDGGGLNYLDRASGAVTVYRAQPNKPNSLSSDQIFSLYREDSGNLWIGTQGGGLNRLAVESGQITTYRLDPNNPNSLASDFIPVIVPAGDGKLWLGTEGFGLDLFDPTTGESVHYRHDPNNPNSLAEETIYALARQPDGRLWIGTLRGGVDEFDPQTGKFTHHTHQPRNENSLIDDAVQALYLDAARNTLWVGTAGGLSRLDLGTHQWQSYTPRSGLLGETITNIQAGRDGKIWLSTNKGLSSLDPSTGSFRNYDLQDGLQSNQFNVGASYAAVEGELFFGGPNGLNSFYPQQFVSNPVPPRVVFTGFQLFNQPVQIGSALLPRPLSQLGTLDLNYDQTIFSLEFAALNYQNSAKNLYQYRLEGFDVGWSLPSPRRSVTYTNLNPGRYRFEVRAANNDGVWNTEPTAITIRIAPPWWRTLLFQALAVIVLLGLVIGAVQLRLRSIQRRNHELEAYAKTRNAELVETNRELHEQILLRQQAENLLRQANDQLQAQVQEISALRDTLREQAIRDPLTSLFNRRYMEATLDTELARAEREGTPLSLIMLDIDHFKQLNDTYSHRAGDEILKALSHLMQERVRRSDVVCRYGGEEFLIIMPKTSREDAVKRCEEIRQAFEGLSVLYQSAQLSVTLSLGIAVYPLHASDSETLVTRADLALYQAKRTGRNRLAVYNEQEIGI